MSKMVTIYGGSGFVGRYITRRMAKAGWRVRVACRRPNEAMFVKPYGTVGQVEPVICNVRNEDSVASVMQGSDAVIYCVGVLAESGKNTFDAVQHEGPERVARIAAAQGINTMVHISAIGADMNAKSEYSQTKALGEQGVLQHMPNAVILRPSIVFGNEDEFFNRFAEMTRMSPVVPLFGANTKFQPVYVDDVAKAAELAATGQAAPGIYELGGPDVDTFRELIQQMLDTIQRRRMIIGAPMFVGKVMGFGFDMLNKLSLGLISGPVTGDQVKNLAVDNVVSPDAKSFKDLGITPASMEAILPDYLWRFRPSGQYAELKASAKNLKS